MTQEEITALTNIVEYLEEDEMDNYEEWIDEQISPIGNNHIYSQVMIIREMLNKIKNDEIK